MRGQHVRRVGVVAEEPPARVRQQAGAGAVESPGDRGPKRERARRQQAGEQDHRNGGEQRVDEADAASRTPPTRSTMRVGLTRQVARVIKTTAPSATPSEPSNAFGDHTRPGIASRRAKPIRSIPRASSTIDMPHVSVHPSRPGVAAQAVDRGGREKKQHRQRKQRDRRARHGFGSGVDRREVGGDSIPQLRRSRVVDHRETSSPDSLRIRRSSAMPRLERSFAALSLTPWIAPTSRKLKPQT